MAASEKQINAAVTAAVVNTISDPGVPANMAAVGPIVEAVAPILVNATNSEPWYRSRVIVGAIVSIAIPVLGALGVTSDVIDANELTSLVVAAGAVIGGIYTLYGRLTTKRPIGQ